MNALDLLKADHKEVKGLLEALTRTTQRAAKTRTELLEKIALAFAVHAEIEEDIFYPEFHNAAKASDDDKLYFEAFEEHRTVKEFVLPDLLDTDVASEQFSGRAKVLKDLILHHAEEEEQVMLPRAAKRLGKQRLDELGAELEERKVELTHELSPTPDTPRRRRQTGLPVST